MDVSVVQAAIRIGPPRSWGNAPGAFLRSLRSPWYVLMTDLQDIVVRATVSYAYGRGLKALNPPLTTRTVTCPTGLGSDSEPVPVTVSGVETFLSDSAQFALEYGCRLAGRGCYTILPSFRHEEPDDTHLSQFTHSEAELVGGLEDVIEYVEGYVKYLAQAILDEYGRELSIVVSGISHLERMAEAAAFPRVTFREAMKLVGDHPDCIGESGGRSVLTRQGERRLMERVNEFVWVTHLDHLSVPFYQAFGDGRQQTASCADLFFGMGEIVGSGERHRTGAEVREALALHAVPETEYAWYVSLKEDFPLRTAGFGMGVERFLMWVVGHDDIRDIPLISRVDEENAWPKSVQRP
jgi:asparaginyl-tRNA synthetase